MFDFVGELFDPNDVVDYFGKVSARGRGVSAMRRAGGGRGVVARTAGASFRTDL